MNSGGQAIAVTEKDVPGEVVLVNLIKYVGRPRTPSRAMRIVFSLFYKNGDVVVL